MTDSIHDQLLQEFVDGELSGDERQRVERLLERDERARRRLTELQQVTKLLTEVGEVAPPSALAGDVSRRVEKLAAPRRGQTVVSGGMRMTKKVLLGLAAAAAIVLAVLSYAGFPPGSRGTEGTIGAANRYRAAQISDKDVVLGDTSGQAFLQSDTFARLLKDPAAVKLLSDARFRSELTANVAQALANPAIVAALTNQQALLALQSFSNCAACGAAVHDQQFVMALRNPEIFAALTNPAFLAAIRANDLASALNAPAMSSALAACGGGCSNLRESLQRPEIVSALSQAQFITMLQTPTFAAAIANPQFVMAVQNSNFVNAIQNPAFASALMDGRLTAALQSQAFLAALTNSGFIASLNAPQLAQALNNALSAGITQY